MDLQDIKKFILESNFYNEDGTINPTGIVYNNCHYTIKETIHSNTYYYLERIFQSQLHCTILTDTLFKSISEKRNTLFVGHGQYTTQIFTLLENQFKKVGIDSNGFISLYKLKEPIEFNEENDKLQFSFEVKLLDYKEIVIILPIATTCSSLIEIEIKLNSMFDKEIRSLQETFNEDFVKINTSKYIVDNTKPKALTRQLTKKRKEELSAYLQRFKAPPINKEIHALFIICDPIEQIADLTGKIDDYYNVNNQLYFDNHWLTITDKYEIRYCQSHDKSGNNSIWYIKPCIHLPANLQLAYKCKMCFPEDYKDEWYHFPLNEISKTPNKHLTFETDYKELPTKLLLQHYNNLENITKQSSTKYFELLKNSHLFGALKFTKSDYLNFIEGDVFYEKNSDLILRYFEDNFIKNINENVRYLYFVTYSVNQQSSFLDDLSMQLKSEKPQIEDIHILRYNEETNYIENFWHSLQDVNNNSDTLLIYYEDVISTGRTLTTLLRRLNFLDISFDYILTLVDRTTINTKRSIIKSFKDIKDPILKFIPFISLYVPVINPLNYKNPRLEEISRLTHILKLTHLDFLKVEIERKIVNSTPRSLNELKRIKQGFYHPGSKYDHIYDDKLLLLFIKHKLHIQVNTNQKLHIDHLTDLLKNDLVIVTRINSGLFSEESNVHTDQHMKVSILLCLCEYPFHYFLPIQKFVFETFLQIVEQTDFNSEDFYKLMDISNVINSNYIASNNFFQRLRKYLKECKSVDIEKVIKNVCYLFKRYVGTDLNRSFKLESLLMNNAVFPVEYDILKFNPYKATDSVDKINQFAKFKALSNDAYWLIYRLIKAENLNVLNSLISYSLNNELKINEAIKMKKIYREFIDLSLFKLAEIPNHEIKNSIESVKACLDKIEQFKATSYLPFEEQLKSLLNLLKNIFPLESDVDYHFCIQYSSQNNSNDKNYVDNIYTVSSDNQFKNNKTDISKKGLIYRFLKGEKKGSLVQTFMPFFRDETRKFQSFEECLKSSADTSDEENNEDFNRLVMEDASTFGSSCNYFKTANVLIAFRLTKHAFDAASSPYYFKSKLPQKSLQGRATLFLFSECKELSPMVFIFIELFRLLFLIKEDLLDYLDLQFRNSAFQQVLLNAEESKLVKDLNHNIAGYAANINEILKKENIEYETKVKTLNKLLTAITSQQFARDADYKFREELFSVDRFVDELNLWASDLIMGIELPIFPDNIFMSGSHEFINKDSLFITSYFWDAILPEIIVNIKKNNTDILSEIYRNGLAKVKGRIINPKDLLNIKIQTIEEKDSSRKIEILFSNFVLVNPLVEINTLKEGGGLKTHKTTLIRRGLGNIEPELKREASSLKWEKKDDNYIRVFETRLILNILKNEKGI